MHNKNILLKQLVVLLVNKGFKKCEVWDEGEYLKAHKGTKERRMHSIASKKIEILHSNGLSYADAQKSVIMQGAQKVNKKNIALLGTPIWSGSVEDLSNNQQLWSKSVSNYFIKGLFRKKIVILLEDTSRWL